MLDALILATVLVIAVALFHPRIRNAPGWRAIVTPLASIIGSGFLVIGPILKISYGYLAPLVMAGLCALAYLFGAAIRDNIRFIESGDHGLSRLSAGLDKISGFVLVFAYVISVAYYLNLFGSFAVSLSETMRGTDMGRVVTTGIYLVIAAIGGFKGFAALENSEKLAVTGKLAIIGGLLVGLAVYFARAAATGSTFVQPVSVSPWHGIALAAGLLVTVQGFETSRYLGDTYDARTRIDSMRWAQIISTTIYVLYVAMLSYSVPTGTMRMSETAVVELMQLVAPILPLLLVGAALMSQFSAGVADTAGAGGLLHEETRGRFEPWHGYLAVVAIGLVLTWVFNVFEIISYASRAFALYYAIQSLIAALACYETGRTWRSLVYGALAVLGVVIVWIGVPVEG